MKKTAYSLFTLVAAGVLSMAADCSGTNIASCTLDSDCGADQICDIAAGETDGVCVNAECTENEDCALSAATSDFVCPINRGGNNCATTVTGCSDGAVEVVDTLGTSFCGVEEDEANDYDCEAAAVGGVAITVEKASGGSATICVDAAGTCTDGQCS
jgi:hypothetical protein